jgi:hypothetical protein
MEKVSLQMKNKDNVPIFLCVSESSRSTWGVAPSNRGNISEVTSAFRRKALYYFNHILNNTILQMSTSQDQLPSFIPAAILLSLINFTPLAMVDPIYLTCT